MSDIIKLLPDHIANQIAAGEVVQRPASVVKELIENAIDAGATKINLVAKDGGKTLVQIIDNGCGMSAVDARMSFERHATSKIAKADDLFELHTKGFRGEALASIAAIAHVQMKTKRVEDELGTELVIEGSKVVSQEPTMVANGTCISVKNLFFNVPARRNFLGKNVTEYKKVVEEFLRIALVHPSIEMSFHHNDDEIYHLTDQGLRQRIVQIYGDKFNQRLVPVDEETDLVKITGFVTKPEFAKASRDQSYFFVNDRYFKDRYFNHAIANAYEDLVPSGKFPPYFLYFTVPTKSIDVNVHPTKTEIKFEENRAIYAIIRSAVKQALGQFNIAPTLDFEQEMSFNVPAMKKGDQVTMPEIKVNPDYNPFRSTSSVSQSSSSGTSTKRSALSHSGFSSPEPVDPAAWKNFYGDEHSQMEKDTELSANSFSSKMNASETIPSSLNRDLDVERKKPVQLHEKYILTSIKNGFLLIDQYRAHCRILYDQFLTDSSEVQHKSQALLFEETLTMDVADRPVWEEALPVLNENGFDLNLTEKEVVIVGVPVELKQKNPTEALKHIFESFRENQQEGDLDLRANAALAMASALATKGGNRMTVEEMEYLIDALFASSAPQYSPQGKKVIETFSLEEIYKRFE